MQETIQSLKESSEANKTSLETLIAEGLTPVKEEEEEEEEKTERLQASKKPPDQMSADEVVAHITQQVMAGTKKEVDEVKVELATITTLREMDRMVDKYTDFIERAPDIQKEATANPYLSLEKCYILVKQRLGEDITVRDGYRGRWSDHFNSAKKSEESKSSPEQKKGESKSTTKLKIFGEKPGASPASTTQDGSISIRDAAKKALAEMETE